MTKTTVLSTKNLSASQKELLLNGGVGLVEHDFIQTLPIDFNVPETLQNLIFTSQNAVRYFLNGITKHVLSWEKIELRTFCVGQKTKSLLQQNQLKVVEMGQNSADLGEKIAKNYKNEYFSFFCGKQRRDELPTILNKNNITHQEIFVYNTVLNPISIPRIFEGLLFLSPTAVQSYVSVNKIGSQWCFCIGNTTASEVRKHTENIIIAKQPTIENVIVQVIKKLRQK